MYTNTVFIGYMAALFLTLMCLALILLLLVRKELRKNLLLICVGGFSAILFLTGCLYFIFYYRETVQNKFELRLPFRIADYIVSCLLFFSWFLLAGQWMRQERKKAVLMTAGVFTVGRLAISLFFTIFFMDFYYSIEEKSICLIWNGCQGIFITGTLSFLLYLCVAGCRAHAEPMERGYLIAGTALMAFFELQQSFIEIGLTMGRYGISAWAMKVPDPTGSIILALSLLTFLFVFKEDFSPLFFTAPTDNNRAHSKYEETPEKKMADFVQEYNLTAREKEVMELVYEGYTNPEISKELYISVNTVKKHLQNTYEKAGVNSRMELVKLINEANYPPG